MSYFDHFKLKAYVCCILKEVGFTTADGAAIEVLTEMFQSLIIEISRTSRTLCELAGRVQPLPADVILALCDLGVNVNGLKDYAFRTGRYRVPNPTHETPPKPVSLLSAGSKHSLPSYIHNHLPPFPDPHTYTSTPTHKKPITEYEAIREKLANQKRGLEQALNRFKTKTNDVESLFFDSKNDLFPLIAPKPQSRTYLTALLPKDQFYNDEELQSAAASVSCQPPAKKSKVDLEQNGEDDVDEESNNINIMEEHEQTIIKEEHVEEIDNPFLRASKLMPINNMPNHLRW